MNYRLSIEDEVYAVADIQLPAADTLAREPIGQPFSFVSPVQLIAGQRCVLRGESGGYQLQIDRCFGFTFTPQFFVSGTIADKETAIASAS